jgi:ABC-type spermidine/putrescine transport system permease subunit I
MTKPPVAINAAAVSRRTLRYNLLLQGPILLVLICLFVVPLAEILIRGFYGDGFTLKYYRQIFETPAYFTVIGLTFKMVTVVTAVCLVLGYPLAYVMIRLPERTAKIVRVLIVVPLLTSVIVRTYAWMILLGTNGIINQGLQGLGLVDQPVKLLYNFTGVIIGMVYVMLPFMVLTLESVMRNIDQSVLRASYNLGASQFQTFRRVFLPLSLPGVAGGSILVFIMSLGYYITPALLGGPRDMVFAMLIARQVEYSMNWSFASSLATLLLVITLAGFVICNRLLNLQKVFEARA